MQDYVILLGNGKFIVIQAESDEQAFQKSTEYGNKSVINVISPEMMDNSVTLVESIQQWERAYYLEGEE